MERALVELRLLGVMIQDDPLNAGVGDGLEADDFREPLLRAAWLALCDLRREGVPLSVEAVCDRVDTPHGPDELRTLFGHAASPWLAGIGAEAAADRLRLAGDRIQRVESRAA